MIDHDLVLALKQLGSPIEVFKSHWSFVQAAKERGWVQVSPSRKDDRFVRIVLTPKEGGKRDKS